MRALKLQRGNYPTKPMRSPERELDRQLAAGIAEGDREALSRLLTRHLQPLYTYLERRLGPKHDDLISQLVMSTFEEALSKLQPYARGTASLPMRLWLIKLANRHLSRSKREIKPAADDAKENREVAELRRAILAIPARQQDALSLALFEEMPAREIAQALGVRPGRAMHLLRDGLKRAAVIAIERPR